jgi:LacI family transcriptional regulator
MPPPPLVVYALNPDTQSAGVLRGLRNHLQRHALAWTLKVIAQDEFHSLASSGYFDSPRPAAFAAASLPQPIYAWCYKRGIPLAASGEAMRGRPGAAHVGIDDTEVGRKAAAHFLEIGVRQAAVVRGLSALPVRERRNQAFSEACQARKLPVAVFDKSEHADEPAGVIEATLADWVTQQPKPVGVFLYQDREAIWFARQCLRFGLRIPEDVAVLGVDNAVAECERGEPPLSSVNIPWPRVGEEIGLQIQRLLGGSEALPEVLVRPVSVCQRASTSFYHAQDEMVFKAQHLITQHLKDGLGIEDLATRLGTSRKTLHRRFVAALGRGPLEWQIERRVSAAQRLLAETALSVAEIARETGFQSNSHFAKIFRQRQGMSPRAYREHHQT